MWEGGAPAPPHLDACRRGGSRALPESCYKGAGSRPARRKGSMSLKEMVEDLQRRRAKAREMGGPEKVARQHERGKLTCRERIDRLFDKGAFLEFGIHATHQSSSPQMEGKVTPADGLVTGAGKMDGRWVA